MTTFLELQNDVYFWLGTTDRNAAFPRAQIKRLLNLAKDSFFEDCVQSYPDALAVPRTLVADLTDTTAYLFNAQSPTLGDVAYIVEVRLTDNQGALLTECPYSERYRRLGLTYSLLGIGTGITLYTGGGVAAGVSLYCAYVPAAADLVADGDTPSWLPGRFHDVFSLNAARLAYGSGNEQTMSPILLEEIADAEAQARFAFGQRSLSPALTRVR